ncbi:E3 ubiquitin-protein ligase TRIM56-like [Haliotis rubra]|uniref:E3 ubiquitin-protein ligase TRIM56-like n=1 Tax=Haliotis rubra TaxID=36100 RepID=UPI001EE549A8|nr:E3 ubiquitin-protein ligase TRIM56-like [Haliotis rubra]
MADMNEDLSICIICNEKLKDPKLLPCLHIFCECCLSQHRRLARSAACPMCNFDGSKLLPTPVTERECKFLKSYFEICNQGAETTTNDDDSVEISDSDDDKREDPREQNSNSDQEVDLPERSQSVMSRLDESQVTCHTHPEQTAADFCPSCQKLICQKCVSTLHKKCKDVISLQEAVDMNMLTFNTIHEFLTKVYLDTEAKLKPRRARLARLDEQKQQAIESVQTLREHLVSVILEKEKETLKEIEERYEEESSKVQMDIFKGQTLRSCVQKSVDVFECAMSMNGHGELLEIEKAMSERVDQYLLECSQLCHQVQENNISFIGNDKAVTKLERTLNLGEVVISTEGEATPNGLASPLDSPWEGKLSLVACFHGGTRDDYAEPLLTDVVILSGGDVILTDRDNKCLKKFNANGKVLTRVPIPDVPSRIAVISNSKIVVTVMTKKLLLFFSIFGTLRILAQVKTKKQYAYITGTQDGSLLVGTNNCDTIDLISQTGAFLKTVYTQKSEKAVISRPLYLTQSPKGYFVVSDSGRRLMFAVHEDGTNKFTYRPKGEDALECPLGVACDVANHALLVDRDGNSIHLVSPKGTLVKKILTEEDSLTKPCGVYILGRNLLAVTQVDGYVKVYKAEGS